MKMKKKKHPAKAIPNERAMLKVSQCLTLNYNTETKKQKQHSTDTKMDM
jgi:hypothetical protein